MQMNCNLNSKNHQSSGGVQAPDISDRQLEYKEHPQRDKEPSRGEDQPQDVSHCSAAPGVQIDEREETVITSPGVTFHASTFANVSAGIRATEIGLDLRRIPAGFYCMVYHSGLKWKTGSKLVSMDNNIVEWDEQVPIPSNPSATVDFEIYALFELQPTLGCGEQLQKWTVTVKQLLSCQSTFYPENGDDISPCSSLLVAVGKRKYDELSASRVVDHNQNHFSATESQGEIELVTNEGQDALSHYRKNGEKRDLEHSIKQFEHVLGLCPLDHIYRAAAQSNLATAKSIQWQDDESDLSLEIPTTLYRNALTARPVGHLDRPFTLIQLAGVYLAQFEKWKQEVDATRVEILLQEAKGLSPVGSHAARATIDIMLRLRTSRGTPLVADRESMAPDPNSGFTALDLSNQLVDLFERFGDPYDLQHAISILEAFILSLNSVEGKQYLNGLTQLGTALLHRFNRLGDINDLDQAILRFRNAIDTVHDGHTDKSWLINNLGVALLTRFERLGKLNDLEEAISRQTDAVGLTSNPVHLTNLGNLLSTRFEYLGELGDLEQAISRQRDAVDLTPDGHNKKPGYLNNLGISLYVRFGRLGELGDLEQAISKFRDAINLIGDGHPDKSMCLNSLGLSCRARFQFFGDLGDLEQAISCFRDVVEFTPDGHVDKPGYLNNLGNAFLTRFERLGEFNDLEQAISRFRDAVDLTPDGHPEKPGRLNNLGNSFNARFRWLGELNDLEEAISKQRDAINLTLDDHPDKPSRLNNLGISFRARFEWLGELSDLEQAISRQKDAVDLTPDGHPDKPLRLNSFGNSLYSRFGRLGELGDLEQAISTFRDAVHLTPDGHPGKPGYLNNLGNSFGARFKRLGELSDLEQTISRYRDAVDLTPDSHPYKPEYLDNLGDSLTVRFLRLEELGDLEQAISNQRNAVDLIPDGHPGRPSCVNNLGTSFFTRFRRLGEYGDLEQAISKFSDAVDLTPDGHPNKPVRLNNLGNSFRARFAHLGELSNLEEAISRFREAVDLIPDDHPDRPLCLNNLGNAFRVRFEQLGDLSDLEQAISRQSDAVDLTPDGHPDKPGCLTSIATSLCNRFEHLGTLADLEKAISKHRDAVDLTPDGHPDKPGWLNNLGRSLILRFERLGERSDLEQGISIHSDAARSPTGPATARFDASRRWIRDARDSGHDSLFDACSSAVHLLPEMAWIGLPLKHRYRDLLQCANVVREAAATALDLRHLNTAVEWLEQGRSIIWGELFQLRSSYEELSSAHPDHAHRLQQLSTALEDANATHEKSLSLMSENAHSAGSVSLEKEAERHRLLAIERDKLLREIRELPGFKRFLLHKEFSQLQSSARYGPVVILNAAETRCDALIISPDKDVIHVPLPNFSIKHLEALQTSQKDILRSREGKPVRLDHSRKWKAILSALWKTVVKPVLGALKISTPGNLRRIFWCPTGPFTSFPIHAAGLYDEEHSQPGHKTCDFVISSYVPTLGILAHSLDTSSKDVCFLAVPQPESDGLPPLPGVDEELNHIREAFEKCPSAQTTFLESTTGTVEGVVEKMKIANWVHFACHGIQDDENPTESGLCLAHGQRLKLSDMIGLAPPGGGLAFLSACETATGDKDLSDEAIHIAAGMLFAGYGGVVATMWPISDRIAPRVAKDVYDQLFRNGTQPDPREAACALQEAVGRVRESGASFKEWLPFIHVGI